MRLFLVSVALFITGIAFIVAGARATPRSVPAPDTAPTPVASVKQIMNAIVLPNANVIYDAVGTTISAAGIEETYPRDEKAWTAVADSAAAIVESGNLMLMGGRAVDNGEWMTLTRRFAAAGKAALDAAEARKKDGVFEAGGTLNETCDACHERYQRP